MGKIVSKLKSRLRFILIDRDPVTRAEYSRFICSDPDAGSAGNLSGLLRFLLGQMKKRPLRTKNKYGQWLSAPFSAQAGRMPYEEVISSLEKYDVVSFDVFDTLVLRPFLSPKDIFVIAGSSCGQADFRSLRTEAERAARESNIRSGKSSEIKLGDIYSRLGGMDNAEALLSAEITAEMEFCHADPYMQHIFRGAYGLGKKIIITTDMYLPADIIRKLLDKCGYGNYDELLVSCEYAEGKSDGGLFRQIKRKYPDSSIIHFGDNPASDIISARKNGIDAFFYQSCPELCREHMIVKSDDIRDSFIYGLIMTKFFNGEKVLSKWYEYGYGILGIILSERILELRRQSVEEHISPEFCGDEDQAISSIYYRFFGSSEPHKNTVQVCADLFPEEESASCVALPEDILSASPCFEEKQEIIRGAIDFAVSYIEKALMYPVLYTGE